MRARQAVGAHKLVRVNQRPANDNRLAAGAIVVSMGDSIFEYNNTASTGVSNLSLSANAQGEVQQVLSMYPAFNYDTWLAADTYDVPYGREFYGANQGYAGQTSTTVLSRKANGLSQNADLYIWEPGTNDGLENGAAQTQCIANAQSFVNDVIAAGKRCLLVGIRPTGSVNNTSQRIAGRKAVNVGLAAIAAANPGVVYFVNLWAAYDPDADDIVQSDLQTDGLHPSPKGAYTAASQILLGAIQAIIKPGDIMALNGNTELITAAQFSGSGGTSGHANITGTIPTGWTVEFSSGSTATVVCSIVNGKLVLDVTPGASATTIRVRHSANIATTSGTDWLKLMADVETSGGNIRARLEDNANVTNYYASGMIIDPAIQAARAKSITPPWNARSASVRAVALITAPASAAAFQAKVHSMTCKKQTSPKTTRNAGSVPTNTVAPSFTGTQSVGQVQTANVGSWDNNSPGVAITYAYRWYRNGTFLGSSLGTGATYTTVAGDVGTTITVGVSAANSAGRGTEVISAGRAIS